MRFLVLYACSRHAATRRLTASSICEYYTKFMLLGHDSQPPPSHIAICEGRRCQCAHPLKLLDLPIGIRITSFVSRRVDGAKASGIVDKLQEIGMLRRHRFKALKSTPHQRDKTACRAFLPASPSGLPDVRAPAERNRLSGGIPAT